MSDGIKAMHEAIEDCDHFLERHNIAWKDLTLEEKHARNLGNLTKLKQRLEDRGIQLSPGLKMTPPDEWESHYEADIPDEVVDTIKFAQDIQLFTDLPGDATLFWADEEVGLYFYRDTLGRVFITDEQELSDSVTEEEDRGDKITGDDIMRTFEHMARTCEGGPVVVASGPLAEAFNAIASEREYQEHLWGNGSLSGGGYTAKTEAENNVRSLDEWTLYILRYANRLANTNCRDEQVYQEKLNTLRKIAALCVAAMEQLGAPLRDCERNEATRSL